MEPGESIGSYSLEKSMRSTTATQYPRRANQGSLTQARMIAYCGQLFYGDKVPNLRRQFLTSKLIKVCYAQEVSKKFRVGGMEMIKMGQAQESR
jgi:hypothetical protein